ncbi:hypothetical protein BVX98_01795 [bacterium F11]|nr:hypothetical protein BVX98_01795 [bacterium F11]
MLSSIIPKELHFFDLLVKGGVNAHQVTIALKELVHHWHVESEQFEKIRDIEREGDLLTHEIIDRLNRTFVTPIDREDIHELAGEIDDLCDIVQALADRMQLYELGNEFPKTLFTMVDLLEKSGKLIAEAIKEIHNFRRRSRIRDYLIEVKGIENEADDLLKHALADLFRNTPDPLFVIKWKEIFESVETAHDKCSSIANTLEGIIVKNA